jgi:hypothetical protein
VTEVSLAREYSQLPQGGITCAVVCTEPSRQTKIASALRDGSRIQRTRSRELKPSPGKYAGQGNDWLMALIYPVVTEFDKSAINFPSIKRYPGGASNDLRPNLRHPENPVPFLDMKKTPRVKGGGAGAVRIKPEPFVQKDCCYG